LSRCSGRVTLLAMNAYDVAVVGGGAAGLSAALVLARARRRVVVVDAGNPRNAPAAHMHGFLGSDGLPPAALLAAARAEVVGYGGVLVDARVRDVRPSAAGPVPGHPAFVVSLDDGAVLDARRVLVATGLRDDVPNLPGVAERWGRDLLHCPYCHGYEVRDQPLGVLAARGAVQDALAHTHLVRQWSDDVVFFANGETLASDQRLRLQARAVGVVDESVAGLVVVDDRLTGVGLESGQVVPRAAVFVRPRFVPQNALLVNLGCAVQSDGWTVTDPTGRTSLPGVWAAGNAVDPRAQVVTAAGQGSAAAIALNNDLVEEDVAAAVTAFRLGLPAPVPTARS
jgi:thioredoxin reductase